MFCCLFFEHFVSIVATLNQNQEKYYKSELVNFMIGSNDFTSSVVIELTELSENFAKNSFLIKKIPRIYVLTPLFRLER